MKKFIKNNKKWATLLGILFLLPFFLVFLLKQPVFFSYKFIEIDSLSESEILKQHVKFLSENNRTTERGQERIVQYINNVLESTGIGQEQIEIQEYKIEERIYKNIIVHLRTKDRKRIYIPKYIIGAHYDAFGSLPGADDNASAVAGILEIARILNLQKNIKGRDIDLVFYSTEEPPFFSTNKMGSYVHAESINPDDNVELVMILEMIGYFSEEDGSQEYPLSFLDYLYPTTGNYIAIVSNMSNMGSVRSVKKRFQSYLKKNDLIDTYSMNAPANLVGIDFSDHRNYWKFDTPALMITDTAFYRNKNYHTPKDTYEKLDYIKMKEVVDATISTVLSL